MQTMRRAQSPSRRRGGAGDAFLATIGAVVSIAIIVALPAMAQGDEERLSEPWHRATSAHFAVYTNAGENAAQRAILALELLRDDLVAQAPPERFAGEIPFHTYLFRDSDQLEPFLPGALPGTAGSLVARDEGVYGATLWTDDRGGANRFLTRQYLEWVLAETLPELPDWFQRGLISFYETFELSEGRVHLGKPEASTLRSLRYDVAATRVAEEMQEQAPDEDGPTNGVRQSDPPATAGESTPASDTEEARDLLRFSDGGRTLEAPAGSEYATLTLSNPWDWALVHYLILGNDENRTDLPRYFEALTVGREDPDRAFQEAFGRSRAALVPDLEEYVLQERHRFLRVPIDSGVLATIEVSPMAPAAVAARLGDLLLHSLPEPPPEVVRHAEEFFQRALTLDPDQPLAHAGLGDLAARSDDYAGAAESYQRALAGEGSEGAGNGLLQFRFGDSLLASLGGRRPSDPESTQRLDSALAALRRATELRPDFPSAWERLGYGLTLAAQPSREAVTALERALELRPTREDLVSNLVLAQARLGDHAGVRTARARLRSLGADAATLQRAREVELRLLLHLGRSWLREERLDDAVAAFAQVRAESSDPALVAAADEQIEFLAAVTQRNLYAALYQKAEAQIDAIHPEARASVEELLALAKPGLQREAAEALAERLARASGASLR